MPAGAYKASDELYANASVEAVEAMRGVGITDGSESGGETGVQGLCDEMTCEFLVENTQIVFQFEVEPTRHLYQGS